MEEVKNKYEGKLLAATLIRNALIIPSCCLSGALLLLSLASDGGLTVMWLAIFAFNMLNFWVNKSNCKHYEQMLEGLEEKKRLELVRGLNPHKK